MCKPYTPFIRERPMCRRQIGKFKLRPCENPPGWWNGYSALDSDDHKFFLSSGMKAEMRKMVAEGIWPAVQLKVNQLPRETESARCLITLTCLSRLEHA